MKYNESFKNYNKLNILMRHLKKNDQGTQNDCTSENSYTTSNIGTKETN